MLLPISSPSVIRDGASDADAFYARLCYLEAQSGLFL